MQKKILLIVIICTVFTAVDAQIKKGSLLLGGQLGVTSLSTKSVNSGDQKNSYVNITVSAGKTIRENLLLGVSLLYSYNSTGANLPYTQQQNGYGAGVFVRKYKTLGKGFYLFGQGSVNGQYNTGRYRNYYNVPNYDNDTKGYDLAASFYPGVSYAISHHFQIETGFSNLIYIDYNHSKMTAFSGSFPSPSTTSSFTAGSSLSNYSGFVVAFRFLLN